MTGGGIYPNSTRRHRRKWPLRDGRIMRAASQVLLQMRDGNSRFLHENLGEIVAVEVHHLVPRGDEVVDEFLLRVGTSVDFGDGT